VGFNSPRGSISSDDNKGQSDILKNKKRHKKKSKKNCNGQMQAISRFSKDY